MSRRESGPIDRTGTRNAHVSGPHPRCGPRTRRVLPDRRSEAVVRRRASGMLSGRAVVAEITCIHGWRNLEDSAGGLV